MSGAFEIEVKFYVAHVHLMRTRLLELGAPSLGRVFEVNVCFENQERTFRKRDMLLRLRKDDQVRLTVKLPPGDGEADYKVYRELEVVVDDFDTCRAMLQALGFSPEQTYEKWRETFLHGDTKLLLDTTPYGAFLEIEGPKTQIRGLAERLELPWTQRILLNYLAMFEIVRREAGLPFKDMTFANFESAEFNLRACLPLMWAAQAGRP